MIQSKIIPILQSRKENKMNNTIIETYDSSDQVYRKKYHSLLKQDYKEIKKAYYNNTFNNPAQKRLDSRQLSNNKKHKYHLKKFLETYKKIRDRNLGAYDKEKTNNYINFLNIYEKIEEQINKNSQSCVYTSVKRDEKLSSLNNFYFDNYSYKSEYHEYLTETREDDKEYALFIHYNLHTLIKILFEFMYDNNIEISFQNVLKLTYFVNNFPFRIIENIEIIDDTTYESIIIGILPLLELYYTKIVNAYNDIKSHKTPNTPDTPQQMFLKIIDSINNCNHVYKIHLVDIIEYLVNNDYNNTVYTIPLNIVIQSLFENTDDKNLDNNKKYVKNNNETLFLFGTYTIEIKDINGCEGSYKYGYDYLMKKQQ